MGGGQHVETISLMDRRKRTDDRLMGPVFIVSLCIPPIGCPLT
jgi:hypothetical protein